MDSTTVCSPGLSYGDKSARLSPAQFEKERWSAFSVAPEPGWIYGFGSAWQTEGPYGKGSLVPDFKRHIAAIRQVIAGCGTDSPAVTSR